MKFSRAYWPNIITLSNLSLGMIAMLLVTVPSDSGNNMLVAASFLVMFAALTDRLDGKVARKLDAESELGKELDSLADLVSFGIAPIIIAWKLGLSDLKWIGIIICVLYPMAGAFRLARYNSTDFDNIFTGVPITIAGALLALINLINCFLLVDGQLAFRHTIITAITTLILSYLMVSKIRIAKR
jgi:CDP-diacylglycerol--serine O-phosphatidyltransferase